MRFGLGILPAAGLCASVYVTAVSGAPPAGQTSPPAAQASQPAAPAVQPSQTQSAQPPSQDSASEAAQRSDQRVALPSQSQSAPATSRAGAPGAADAATAAQDLPAQVDYARDILPILQQTCFECHGPKKGRGQLRLHTRALIDEGRRLRPGDRPRQERRLAARATPPRSRRHDPARRSDAARERPAAPAAARPDPRMDRSRRAMVRCPRTDRNRDDGRGWRRGERRGRRNGCTFQRRCARSRGCRSRHEHWRGRDCGRRRERRRPRRTRGPRERRAAESEPAPHWAYVKPIKPALPDVSQPAWAKNPIDRFILARLDREQLTPAAPAAKHTWLRRVTLDLTGLPPTPAELDAFLARQTARRPRTRRRSPARLAALRRALGAPVARPRALRRHQRPREGQPPLDLAVPRLGDRRPQRGHALRPLHDRTDRRRHASRTPRPPSASPRASIATR